MTALTGYPGGRVIADLATELGVSESTVKRNLAQFARVSAPCCKSSTQIRM